MDRAAYLPSKSVNGNELNMPKKLTRQDFLKLSGVASAGMFLFACDAATKFLMQPKLPGQPPHHFQLQRIRLCQHQRHFRPRRIHLCQLQPRFQVFARFCGEAWFRIGLVWSIPKPRNYQEVMTREFNLCISDSAFHWATNVLHPLRPSQDQFDFTNPDAVVTYAQQHISLAGSSLSLGNEPTLPAWSRKEISAKRTCLQLSKST